MVKPLMNQSQTDFLLAHFKTRPSISAIEAQAMYRIRSLSRRINDLEAMGFRFGREHCKDTTGQRYVRYHYLGKPQPRKEPRQVNIRGRRGFELAAR